MAEYQQRNTQSLYLPTTYQDTRAPQGKLSRSVTFSNNRRQSQVAFLTGNTPWKYTQLTLDQLVQLPYVKLADILIRTNPTAAFFLSTYTYYCNTGGEWVGDDEDEQAIEYLNNFFRRSEVREGSFSSQIDEVIYDLIVKGASFTELYYDDAGIEPLGIARIPAESAVFVNENGNTLIGQLKEDRSLATSALSNQLTREDINVFIDPEDPETSMYFKYEKFRVSREMYRGVGMFESIVSTVLSLISIRANSMAYFEGQARPQSIISVPIQELLRAGIFTTEAQIEAYTLNVANAIEDAFNKGDGSDIAIIEAEIKHELRQGMNRSNLTIADLLFRIYEREFERGSGIPGAITGSNENRSEGQGSTEDNSFKIKIDSVQNKVESVYNYYAPTILTSRGIPGEPTYQLNRVNIEGRKQEAEILEILAKAYKDLIEQGIMSREQAQALLKMQNKTYEILDDPDLEAPTVREIMEGEEETTEEE